MAWATRPGRQLDRPPAIRAALRPDSGAQCSYPFLPLPGRHARIVSLPLYYYLVWLLLFVRSLSTTPCMVLMIRLRPAGVCTVFSLHQMLLRGIDNLLAISLLANSNCETKLFQHGLKLL
jgi:hypothetical protein